MFLCVYQIQETVSEKTVLTKVSADPVGRPIQTFVGTMGMPSILIEAIEVDRLMTQRLNKEKK